MTRVKRGLISKARHNKLLSATKGYRGTKSKLVKTAKEAFLHASAYSFHGRKLRKRDFRRLWTTRISEAVKKEGLSYSVFIHGLKQKKIELDRKILAHLIAEDPKAFKTVVDIAKEK